MSTLPTHNDRRRRALRDDDSPIDPIDEMLVAYLDGELDEHERRRLEDQLISDASLRQRLSELESGWQMLDHLPRPTVTEDFARSTVEMIAAGASQALQVQRRRRPWRRLGHATLLVAITLAMAAAGYAASRWIDRARFEAQLADLPLAENLPAYLLDVDLELMRQLSGSEVWNDAMQLAGDAGGLSVPEEFVFPNTGIAERAGMLKRLEPETRRDLVVQWNHLQRLPPHRLQEVRQKAEAIRQLDQPDAVLRTMRQYAWWYQELPPVSQQRIQEAPADEKLSVILEEAERSARGWGWDYGAMFGETDRETIYEALKSIARARLEWAEEHDLFSNKRLRFLADLRQAGPHNPSASGISIEEQLLRGMAFMTRRFGRGGPDRSPAADGRADGERPNQNRSGRTGNGDGDEDEEALVAKLFQRPTAEEMEIVEEALSPTALAILNNTFSAEERHDILWRWCIEIINSKSPLSDTPEALMQAYRTLPPEYREILDLKDPTEILNRLSPRRRGGSQR